jgi:hypothetical protein
VRPSSTVLGGWFREHVTNCASVPHERSVRRPGQGPAVGRRHRRGGVSSEPQPGDRLTQGVVRPLVDVFASLRGPAQSYWLGNPDRDRDKLVKAGEGRVAVAFMNPFDERLTVKLPTWPLGQNRIQERQCFILGNV